MVSFKTEIYMKKALTLIIAKPPPIKKLTNFKLNAFIRYTKASVLIKSNISRKKNEVK